MPNNFILYSKLVGSVILWGATWIAGKILAGDLSPYNAGFLRFFFASFFMIYMVKKFTGHYPKIKKEQILPVLLLGFTGVFLYNILFFTGLETVGAGRASLIIAGTPAVMAISAAFLFKEKLTLQKILGFIISLAGVTLVIARGNPFDLLHQGLSHGDLCILGCVVAWAAFSLAGKKTVDILPPVESVAWSCFTGTLMLLPFALSHNLLGEIATARPIDWASLLFLAIMGTGLAFIWYYEALKAIGASKTGIFINLVPVTAVILGFICFSEQIGFSVLAGGLLVIGGVWITNRN